MAKQFGDRASRVTTSEMESVYEELNAKIGGEFCGFELTFSLEEKTDHGDIDILVLLHPDQDPKKVFKKLKALESNKNGYCHSHLYQSEVLGKAVHVDFLVSSDPNLHATKKQYYAFNDLSAVVGVMAKNLNFKYGSEGFFKRYQDKKGNWHDIKISSNLNVGLQCLGLDPKPLWIRKYQDIVNYVSSSLMFDCKMFSFALDMRLEDAVKKLQEIGLKAKAYGDVRGMSILAYYSKKPTESGIDFLLDSSVIVEGKADVDFLILPGKNGSILERLGTVQEHVEFLLKLYKDYIAEGVFGEKVFADKVVTHYEKDAKPSEVKRPKQQELFIQLAKLGKEEQIFDEDYFFKRAFRSQYEEVEAKKKEIEAVVYAKSKYNGEWLMTNFKMKPGPEIGKMLKLISDSFGELLPEVEEELVIAFVTEQLEKE